MALGRNLYLQARALSPDVALQLAELAKIGNCVCVCGAVQMVWEWVRRSISSTPSDILKEAANAARTLRAALQVLPPDDRRWVQKVADQHFHPESKPNPFCDLDWTVSGAPQSMKPSAVAHFALSNADGERSFFTTIYLVGCSPCPRWRHCRMTSRYWNVEG